MTRSQPNLALSRSASSSSRWAYRSHISAIRFNIAAVLGHRAASASTATSCSAVCSDTRALAVGPGARAIAQGPVRRPCVKTRTRYNGQLMPGNAPVDAGHALEGAGHIPRAASGSSGRREQHRGSDLPSLRSARITSRGRARPSRSRQDVSPQHAGQGGQTWSWSRRPRHSDCAAVIVTAPAVIVAGAPVIVTAPAAIVTAPRP